MKKEKTYVYDLKKRPFYNFLRKTLLKLLYRDIAIINLNDKEIDRKSIILTQHNDKPGPIILSTRFPVEHAIWGSHEMLGNYKSRYKYLKNVYYIQKMHRKRFVATILAGFEALFSIYFHRRIRSIPTYHDSRLVNTINYSMDTINNGLPIVIFPENSDNGYNKKFVEIHGGFILLHDRYYKRYNIDLPIYPMSFDKKKRIAIIDKPIYIKELYDLGKTKDDILNLVKEDVNRLYDEYIENFSYKKYKKEKHKKIKDNI